MVHKINSKWGKKRKKKTRKCGEMRKKRLETGEPRCCDCSLLEPPKKSSALSSCVRLVAGSKTRVAEGGRRKARGNWNTSRIPPLPPFVAWEAILKKTTINKTYWEWKLYYLSDNGRQSRLGNCRPSTPCSPSFRLPPRLGYSNCVTGGRVTFDR